jgi:hypothetical protein
MAVASAYQRGLAVDEAEARLLSVGSNLTAINSESLSQHCKARLFPAVRDAAITRSILTRMPRPSSASICGPRTVFLVAGRFPPDLFVHQIATPGDYHGVTLGPKTVPFIAQGTFGGGI